MPNVIGMSIVWFLSTVFQTDDDSSFYGLMYCVGYSWFRFVAESILVFYTAVNKCLSRDTRNTDVSSVVVSDNQYVANNAGGWWLRCAVVL